jgi:porin
LKFHFGSVRDDSWLCKSTFKIFGLLFFLTFEGLGYADDPLPDGSVEQQRPGFLSIEPVYYGELFTNARGGKSTNGATQYQGLLDLGVSLDLERAGSELPGSLFLLAQNTQGRGLSQDFIGDTQVISNIDSFDNIMQVSEYWWESRWIDDKMMLRIGKQEFNTEFQRIEGAEQFIQSTFGLSPSTAFPTYPDQSMGAVALYQLRDELVLKVGLWSAFARGSSLGFSDSDSFLAVGELERRYALLDGQLPGIFAVGALYESDGEVDGEPVSAVREYFIQGEQSLYRESPEEEANNQGLAVFAGYYPRIRGEQVILESIGDSAVAGLTYTGLLSGRDEDVVGLGVAWAELYQGGTNRELVTEVFYRANWSKRMSIQPDLQYISSPSGIFRDALAVGVRVEVRPW